MTLKSRATFKTGVTGATALLVLVLAGVSSTLQAQSTTLARKPRRGVLGVLDTVPVSPTHARIQTRTYDFKQAGVPMTYELFVPSGYNASRPTPLIVALHCLSSVAADMIRYESLTELAETRGYIVVAPMGYNDHGWYGSRGNAGTAGRRGGPTSDPPNLGELSELDVMNVLGIVRGAFNVDPRRVYLFGHSMGGGGTLHIGIKNPSLFDALAVAAPAASGSPEALAAIKQVPVLVIQGDQDELVNVEGTRRWVAKMKELGMTHKYVEIAGGDHMRVIVRSPENMKQVFDFFDEAGRQ
jgi:poly(3-hydroxybutyrate) depolymerase